jgi:hypothetical protein
MQEDWDLLLKFFPADWQNAAISTGAVKGLRKNKSVDDLLRTLLIHLACGHSLRETVVRARKAGLAELSDVALMKRLRKSKEWLRSMCIGLFREQGIDLAMQEGFQIRAFDATTVKEPGKTGSLWRIHYSVRLPSLSCDFFKLTATDGVGSGESLKQFPLSGGDYILADRAYSTPTGISYVHSKNAFVTVRVNTSSLPLYNPDGKTSFNLAGALRTLRKSGQSKNWSVTVGKPGQRIRGRLCAIRKTQQAIELAQVKIRREATRKGKEVKAETLEFAKYIILFTTFPIEDFSHKCILEWYRARWQVELVFKRFKSIAEFGHLPKYDDESAKAWIYGKLFVALLIEKLTMHAKFISPWGCILEESPPCERLEGIRIRS